MGYRIRLGIATTSLMLIAAMESALAAEKVLLRYRGFSRTVAVEDLAVLVDTGEPPQSLSSLLDAAGQDPQTLQSWLSTPLSADTGVLDAALNSWPGEWMLDRLGEAIHPAAGGASRQAMRSALVLSSADDSQITLLEVLENYPTPEVVVEGERIEDAYEQLAWFLRPLMLL